MTNKKINPKKWLTAGSGKEVERISHIGQEHTERYVGPWFEENERAWKKRNRR